MKRILVVDDDPDVREALCSVLEDEGLEVEAARDGREALRALARGPLPDVVLLDWMMPVMNGLEVRRALLADGRLAALPVVVLTADARLGSLAADLGVRQVLLKPCALDALLEAVGASALPLPPPRPQALAAPPR